MAHNTPTHTEPTQLSPMLAAFIAAYTPALSPQTGVIIMSSAEIAAAVDDMVTLSVDDVSEAMLAAGFMPWFSHDGPHGWLLMPK